VSALLLASACGIAAPENTDQLLQHADQVKLANNDEFHVVLKQLDEQAGQLTSRQHDWLDYLHAWQLGYQGDYPQAVSAFDALLAHTQDATVRARARISLIYDQVNTSHYEDAYISVSALVDSLPQVEDRNAHFLSLTAAAYAYNRAGQHDLALQFADKALAYDRSDRSTCIAMEQKAEILYESGKLLPDDPQLRTGFDACRLVADPVSANILSLSLARAQMDHGDVAAALKLLETHDAEILATHSSAAISLFRSVLARCYLLTGDLAHAREYAQSAVDHANNQFYARSVADAYEILYEVANRQNDDKAALAWHEKYAIADKGYLNDISARALAYQMVHQQVLDKKREIEALNEKNRALELRQQIDSKTAEIRLLYIGLLLMGLALVATWAYRTKRSQLKFQKLARRDGLTGIFNRQHFLESAQEVLRYCAKDSREASVLALDLDHFKSVNDMHGHAAGDAVLRRVVAACQARLRSIDIFGRLGGEEFAILLPDCAEEVALLRAEEMRAAIAGLHGRADAAAGIVATASFGVASTQACGYNLPTLLAHADSALYAAKRAGRNRVSMHRTSVEETVGA